MSIYRSSKLKEKLLNRVILSSFIVAFVIHHIYGYIGHYGYDDMEYARLASDLTRGNFDAANHYSFRIVLVGLTAVFYKIFGTNDWASSLPALLFSVGTLILIYHCLKGLNKSYLVIGLALFSFNNWVFFYSDKLMPDVPVMFFIFLFCYLIYSFRYSPEKLPVIVYSFGAALALFLGFNSKETVVLVAPLVLWLFLTDLIQKQNIKFWKQFSGVVLALGFIYLLVCQVFLGNAMERFQSIVSNSYLNSCSYDHQPLAETLKRITYGLLQLFLTNDLLFGFLIIIPALFFIPARSLLKADNPKTFFISASVVLLVSSNFMSISATSYVPMCLDPRHYLFIVPVATVAATMVLNQYFSLKKFWAGLFGLLCTAFSVSWYLHSNITWHLYLPVGIAVAVALLLKPNRNLGRVFSSLLLIALLIQPVDMMVYARKIDYNGQKKVVKDQLIGKNGKCVVVTDVVQKRVGDYFNGFSPEAPCQFISYAEADTFHFRNNERKYLLNNWYTRYLSGMDDQDLPFYAVSASNPVFRDERLKQYIYELGDDALNQKLLFHAENDFESPRKYWNNASDLSIDRAFSGKHSEKLGEFSVCCNIPIDSIMTDSVKQVVVFPKLRMLAVDNAECSLVISIDANGEQYYWKGFELSKYMKSKASWWQVSVSGIIKPTEIRKNSTMKIYVWNNKKNEIYIDDLNVQIYFVD